MNGDLITEPKKDTSSDQEPVKCPAPPGGQEPWCENWEVRVSMECCIIVRIRGIPVPVPYPVVQVWCEEGYLA